MKSNMKMLWLVMVMTMMLRTAVMKRSITNKNADSCDLSLKFKP